MAGILARKKQYFKITRYKYNKAPKTPNNLTINIFAAKIPAMTLYTSYFSFVHQIPPQHLVSIAGAVPPGFPGTQYRKLAPKYDWWKKWHDEKLSNEWYIEKYYDTVLNKLNPIDVATTLGDNKILLCWESPEKFCHRHIVAEWLTKSGIMVSELTVTQKEKFINKLL